MSGSSGNGSSRGQAISEWLGMMKLSLAQGFDTSPLHCQALLTPLLHHKNIIYLSAYEVSVLECV